jgi:hypothetical protein
MNFLYSFCIYGMGIAGVTLCGAIVFDIFISFCGGCNSRGK